LACFLPYRQSFLWFFTIIICFLGIVPSLAQTVQETDGTRGGGINVGASGLPLPRFVSLRSGRVNVRVGPDRSAYAIAWIYSRQGLPVEIIEEYDNWRRIRDSDGDGGWVDQAFLSSKRTVISAPWLEVKSLSLRDHPDETSARIAELEMGVIGDLRQCRQGWCEVDIRADCDLIEPQDSAIPSFLPQFISDIFSSGDCSKNYRGWLKQSELWGVYPDEEI